MRSDVDRIVTEAVGRARAVPAFTCYDFATATAVVEAAEQRAESVILLVAPRTVASAPGLQLVAALRGLADRSSVPVAVQLDHATDIEAIAAGVAAGADSVLADGSSLTVAENVAFVRRVVHRLAGRDVAIEAELGGLAGDEDRAIGAPADGPRTDPAQVADFVDATGAGLLAVAIGNVHGAYVGPPQLDWELARLLARRSPVPLVLHGASGVPDDELSRAASCGIGKVNVNTELRTAVLALLEDRAPAARADGQNLLGLLGEWHEVVRDFAGGRFAVLGSRSR